MKTAKQKMKDQNVMDQPFVITSVARADIDHLREEGDIKLSKKRIRAIPDHVMERIASKMANAYVENVFWIDLGIIADDVLTEEK